MAGKSFCYGRLACSKAKARQPSEKSGKSLSFLSGYSMKYSGEKKAKSPIEKVPYQPVRKQMEVPSRPTTHLAVEWEEKE